MSGEDDCWEELVGSWDAGRREMQCIIFSFINYDSKPQRQFQLDDEIYLPNCKTESVTYKNSGLCKCRLAY